MVTIQINPIYITDDMLDSMSSDEVLNLLKSVLDEIRKETISNAPEANMYADQIDETTTVEEALEIIKKPSNFTKKMKTSPRNKMKEECPYHGVNYAPSGNNFYCRINQIVLVKRKDPMYVAMVRDLYCDALELDVPRNRDEFNAVGNMLNGISKKELAELEVTIKAKIEKHNLR